MMEDGKSEEQVCENGLNRYVLIDLKHHKAINHNAVDGTRQRKMANHASNEKRDNPGVICCGSNWHTDTTCADNKYFKFITVASKIFEKKIKGASTRYELHEDVLILISLRLEDRKTKVEWRHEYDWNPC